MTLPYGAKIIATGIYLPEKRLTNKDLEKIMETTDEWLVQMTGIRERRIAADGENTTDLAVNAAEACLKNANFDAAELDMIIMATYTPDRLYSASGCVVQDRIGATKAAAFDIEVACSGYVYGLTIAAQFIKSGMYKNVLVIGADINSRFMDYTDRKVSILFGDGAAATLVSRCEPGIGVLESVLGSDGSGSEKLFLPAGGAKMPASHQTVENNLHYMYMDGNAIFKWSVRKVPKVMDEILAINNLTFDDIQLVIPHQANIRIIEAIAKRFDCPMDKMFVNLDKYGNTVAATIPIALHEAIEEGRVAKGDKVLLIGFGGGLTWGGQVITI
jgi:3-oxoacyl-[acyl-carrier-protein] synthase-3